MRGNYFYYCNVLNCFENKTEFIKGIRNVTMCYLCKKVLILIIWTDIKDITIQTLKLHHDTVNVGLNNVETKICVERLFIWKAHFGS